MLLEKYHINKAAYIIIFPQPKETVNVNIILDIKHTNKIYWSQATHWSVCLSNALCWHTNVWRISSWPSILKVCIMSRLSKLIFWLNIWSTNHNIHGTWENHVFHVLNVHIKHTHSLRHNWQIPRNTRHTSILKFSFLTSNDFFCYQFKVQDSSVAKVLSLSLQQQLKLKVCIF